MPASKPTSGESLYVMIDREVSRLKLAALGVEIDALTPEQEDYLDAWRQA